MLKCQLAVLTAQLGTQFLYWYKRTYIIELTHEALLGDMEAETNAAMLAGVAKHVSRY